MSFYLGEISIAGAVGFVKVLGNAMGTFPINVGLAPRLGSRWEHACSSEHILFVTGTIVKNLLSTIGEEISLNCGWSAHYYSGQVLVFNDLWQFLGLIDPFLDLVDTRHFINQILGCVDFNHLFIQVFSHALG